MTPALIKISAKSLIKGDNSDILHLLYLPPNRFHLLRSTENLQTKDKFSGLSNIREIL